MTHCYYQHFLSSSNILFIKSICLRNQERCNIMANNSVSQKSSKGVQLSRIIAVQSKVGNVKGVSETKDQGYGSKVNPSESATTLTHERIAERARTIWQNHGCKSGEDEQNWFEAEAQLKAELGIN